RATRRVRVAGRRGFWGARRRDVRLTPRRLDLEQPLGPFDVLEAVLAEVAEPDAGGLAERTGRRGAEDLATVGDRRDARRPVDLQAVVVVIRDLNLAGVEAHPDADGAR